MSGTLPLEFYAMTSLFTFYTYTNSISGSIPPGVANMTHLQYIKYQNNRMSGTVPNLSTLTDINHMLLHENRFASHLKHNSNLCMQTFWNTALLRQWF